MFAFDDGREVFQWGGWLANFAKVLVMVAIAVIIHDLGHDIAAKKYGFKCEYSLWGVKKFGFTKKAAQPKEFKFLGKKHVIESLPIGIIISIIVTLLSAGGIPFAAVSSYNIGVEKTTRLGKKFIGVTGFEDAKIALAGPMANIILLLLIKAFNTSGAFDQFMVITAVMAGFDILPLPGLDGFKVLFGSRQLYVFAALFTYMIIFLAFMLSTIPAIILALAFSLIALALFVFFKVYR